MDLKTQFYCSAVLILTVKKNGKKLIFGRRVDHSPCSSLKCTNNGPTHCMNLKDIMRDGKNAD